MKDSELIARLRAIVIMDEVSSDNPLGRDAADRIEAMSDFINSDPEIRIAFEHRQIARAQEEERKL